MPKLLFVGNPNDGGIVSHLSLAQHKFHVEKIFKRRALTGASPVTSANDNRLLLAALHPGDEFIQRFGGMGRMVKSADGLAVVERS